MSPEQKTHILEQLIAARKHLDELIKDVKKDRFDLTREMLNQLSFCFFELVAWFKINK